MKITDKDYAILKSFVAPFMTAGNAKHYNDKGLSPMRFRWDCLYASRIKIGDCAGLGQGDVPLYAYMNDSHIDTALRAIQHELGA